MTTAIMAIFLDKNMIDDWWMLDTWLMSTHCSLSFQIMALSNFNQLLKMSSICFQLHLPVASPTWMCRCWHRFGMMLTSPLERDGSSIRSDINMGASKAAMSHQMINHFQLLPLLAYFVHLIGIPWDGYVRYLLSDSAQSYSRQSDQVRGAERQPCLHAFLDPQNHLGPCYAHLLPEDQPLRGYNIHVFKLYKPWL